MEGMRNRSGYKKVKNENSMKIYQKFCSIIVYIGIFGSEGLGEFEMIWVFLGPLG